MDFVDEALKMANYNLSLSISPKDKTHFAGKFFPTTVIKFFYLDFKLFIFDYISKNHEKTKKS